MQSGLWRVLWSFRGYKERDVERDRKSASKERERSDMGEREREEFISVPI